MYNVISKTGEFAVTLNKDEIAINDKNINWDLSQISEYEYSVIADGVVYNIFVESIDKAQKTVTLKVNGELVDSKIQESIDQVLKNMGIDFSKNQKKEPIKAPMPGLILKVLVENGQSIKKGDPVLILEAMKMENVFKAPADAVVKDIHVNAGQAVEKGQVLITME
jgi:biotin carboxyl carrier protein